MLSFPHFLPVLSLSSDMINAIKEEAITPHQLKQFEAKQKKCV